MGIVDISVKKNVKYVKSCNLQVFHTKKPSFFLYGGECDKFTYNIYLNV